MPQPFFDLLSEAVLSKRTPTMVGLDPRWENLPPALRAGDRSDPRVVADAFRTFCLGVIDVVFPHTAIVKPQAAFFEQYGPAGMTALADVIDAAVARGLCVVLDGKRHDIGTTAEAYAAAYLGRKPRSAWGADALTVGPYLGDDSLTPFTKICQTTGAGVFVLVKTSNPGGKTFQDQIVGESQHDSRKLYEIVADHVEGLSAATAGRYGYGVAGAVVGATYPEQLAELRRRMPHVWLLVPGFGAQGGAAKDVVGAFDDRGLGAVVNNSRGLIFAYEKEPYKSRYGAERWQDAIATATTDMTAQLRAETPAGRL